MVWVAATLAALGLLIGARALRLRRRVRPADIYWRGTLVLSLIVGVAVAIAYDSYYGRDRVVMPEGAGDVELGPVDSGGP